MEPEFVIANRLGGWWFVCPAHVADGLMDAYAQVPLGSSVMVFPINAFGAWDGPENAVLCRGCPIPFELVPEPERLALAV